MDKEHIALAAAQVIEETCLVGDDWVQLDTERTANIILTAFQKMLDTQNNS